MKKILLIGALLMANVVAFAQKKIVVAQDGSGDYTTVQEALNAVPAGNKKPVKIKVEKGIYKQVVIVDATKNFISLIGEDKDNTILTFNNHAGTRLPNGDTVNTWTSASFFVYGNDFHAENLTFQNDAGFTAGQAVDLREEGNRA